MYDGEAPNERDDEHVINFYCESFGGKNIFCLNMRLNKALDAQTRTAKAWTVGLRMTMGLWSHVSAIHTVITLTPESCESVLCDGCVDTN